MRNLNLENVALLDEVRKNEMRNVLLFNKSFPAIFDELGLNVDVCHLTDEELAVSDVTVERIELADALHDFMWKCRGLYLVYKMVRTAPDWLVESGYDDNHFEAFFQHLGEIESDSTLMLLLQDVHAMSMPEAREKYALYVQLRASEKTREAAVQKIKLAYDVNGLLRKLLAFNGYTGVEIEQIARG